MGDSDAHIVRGLIAILLTLYSGRTPQQILSQIQRGADDLGIEGKDPKYGKGRINVARSVINETESPYEAYNGVGKWNAYDIVFRAARFKDGKRVERDRTHQLFARR